MAKALGIKRSGDAHAAFLRALRGRPAKERAAMTKRESERLDRLELRSAPATSASPTNCSDISPRSRSSVRASPERLPDDR